MASRVTTVTSGTNDVETTSLDVNNFNTDFLSAGVVGAIIDDAPDTGGFAVEEQGTPDRTVIVNTGTAYVTATPNGGAEQLFRVNLTAQTNVTCAVNTSGSTVYDKILIVLQEDLLVDPPASNDWSSETGANALLQAERHTAAGEAVTADNAYELAEVTLTNGYTTILDANITDSREVVVVDNADWTTYTPVWTTLVGSPTLGNGTLTGRYKQIANTVVGEITFKWGSTTSSAGDTTWRFSLPVDNKDIATGGLHQTIGTAYMENYGSTGYMGVSRIIEQDQNKVDVAAILASGTYGSVIPLTATVPFTWATNDFLTVSFRYEIV